ncbi:2,3,4,5-tetrahydropyridine-2,6-dicarboxylate N-acetyltransferase [Alkaliphilus peptidifermentans]|uniref:2,3,4,5-tetrahydropyridine-2,6-dicarboxylate N-acetyltransferase n=1 Tax=Alkaliphilus peptidifermentans DSM 18978 TaxID=1120976 RepID=A0A1G5K851_9FIRM|nr:2,3,4,5-tetrahydropyridine-2,6-dicarboxylate N-acetyltransferase [Alkaliphilus peptidifermentans]SCY96707.1 2,3,4,5-tetrahydropyridine-2,6-dicarboxylate N-acetyltransferase [Alkaliphilus peptidifermentans DSM 18978]
MSDQKNPLKYIDFTSPETIAKSIKTAKKSTPVKVYIQGYINYFQDPTIQAFGNEDLWILIGEYDSIKNILAKNDSTIKHYHIEYDRRNSAVPLLNTLELQARIEPGALIRESVIIKKNAVILMGAVINVGAVIGENTMIDMNCVIGARVIIGNNVHVGAGAVIAGVLEPPSVKSVVIEDNVFIGSNSVVLEGVHIGEGAVVAAGSIVTTDVPANSVVAGMPASLIKMKDKKTLDKVKLVDDLRG